MAPWRDARLAGSAGRPAHALTSENMQVEVGHGVQGVVAHVEHEAIATLGQTLGHRFLGIKVIRQEKKGNQSSAIYT